MRPPKTSFHLAAQRQKMKQRRILDRLPADFGEIRLRRKRRHKLRIRILDEEQPHDTRWVAQLPVQRASVIGWWGLKGFTDEAAERGEWHGFEVLGRAKVRAFLKAIAPLLRLGLVAIRVDGQPVTLAPPPPSPRPAAARRPAARAVRPAGRDTQRKRA
jgi:hypothetical protein